MGFPTFPSVSPTYTAKFSIIVATPIFSYSYCTPIYNNPVAGIIQLTLTVLNRYLGNSVHIMT